VICRFGALLLIAVVADATLASFSASALASPDLLLLSVAAVAAARGRERGAAFGFASGLAADAFLATPAGLCALAFTLVGHAAGAVGAGRRWRPWACAVLTGAACLAGFGLVSVGAALLGAAPLVLPGAFGPTAGGVATAALVAPFAFPLVARLLAPRAAGR